MFETNERKPEISQKVGIVNFHEYFQKTRHRSLTLSYAKSNSAKLLLFHIIKQTSTNH